MRPAHLLMLFILLLLVPPAYAQQFEDCNTAGKLYVKVDQPAIFNGSLQQYFDSTLNHKLNDFEGTILITLQIDSSGNCCCLYIRNNTSPVSSSELKAIIDKMPVWKPAFHMGHNVRYAMPIQLFRHELKLIFSPLVPSLVIDKSFNK